MFPFSEYVLANYGLGNKVVRADKEGVAVFVSTEIYARYLPGDTTFEILHKSPIFRGMTKIRGKLYFAFWGPGQFVANEVNSSFPMGGYKIDTMWRDDRRAKQFAFDTIEYAKGTDPIGYCDERTTMRQAEIAEKKHPVDKINWLKAIKKPEFESFFSR